jgi:hypothetical protein
MADAERAAPVLSTPNAALTKITFKRGDYGCHSK